MSLDISVLTYSLIDALPRGEAFDLLEGFAGPLPVLVITRLMGLPDEDARQLQAWSNAMVAMYQARRNRAVEEAASKAAAAFEDYPSPRHRGQDIRARRRLDQRLDPGA